MGIIHHKNTLRAAIGLHRTVKGKVVEVHTINKDDSIPLQLPQPLAMRNGIFLTHDGKFCQTCPVEICPSNVPPLRTLERVNGNVATSIVAKVFVRLAK